MKKTIITLMALTGVTMADSIAPFTDLDWGTLGAGTSWENGKMKFVGGGSTWLVYGSGASLTSPITLSKDDVLTFSYSVELSGIDSVTTFSLISESNVVSMGHAYKYSDNDTTHSAIRLGSTTTENASNKYVISDSGNRTDVTYIRSANYIELDTFENATKGDDYTLTFKIAYNEEKNQFVGSLSYGEETKTIDLGNEYKLTGIAATFDGNTTTYVSNMTLSVANIPEPATATLSLLALAGMASRRRRR